ncbi:MAG: Zn-ribbon domain-containing OB-fold protein [Desulforhopalus sp.]
MSMFGQVYVKDNRYKIQGDFHHMTPNRPVRNSDDNWRLLGITNPRDMTYIHSYGGEAIFFESLGKGKLLATGCDADECGSAGTMYLPFRIHCPDCLGKNSVVDLTEAARNTAKIHTFMVCERSGAFNLLQKPIKFINIEFAGVATILMSYLSIGEPKFGMRVVPIFRTEAPTFTILDLSWVVEGTKAEQLPEGFTF